MYSSYDVGDVTPCTFLANIQVPCLGVADVVEVDAVHVVVSGYLRADVSQIFCRFLAFGVHVALVTYFPQHRRMALA